MLVQLDNVSHSYQRNGVKIEALIAVSCAIQAKDRVALVGNSGSGKSTLLHLMGNLETASTGDLSWPTLETTVPLRPSQIGCIFQMASLLPTLNVLENVTLPALLMGQDQACAEQNAMEMLQQFNLDHLVNQLPDELSGGQLQRIAIVRTLTLKPKLILADEPTGQLDHPTATHLIDLLLSYLENSDTALVIATHDESVAQRMDRRWQMSHGTLEIK